MRLPPVTSAARPASSMPKGYTVARAVANRAGASQSVPMRKWLLAGGVTLLVVAGIVAFALANLGRFLERDRGWIAAQASHAVGRAVHFDEIGVSLRGGIAARLG